MSNISEEQILIKTLAKEAIDNFVATYSKVKGDKFSQKAIGNNFGFNKSKFSKMLNVEETQYLDLILFIEILEKTNHRHLLLNFAKKYDCKMSKFILSKWPEYIDAVPVEIDESDNINEEYIRMTHQHQASLENKLKKIGGDNLSQLNMIFTLVCFILISIGVYGWANGKQSTKVVKLFSTQTLEIKKAITENCSKE